MLGRYALYEKVASGGMASVHIGRLLGPVGFARTVAVKRMHPQFAEDPEFVAMFLDEARLAARIRHPNVVPTIDVVATAGELFLVMDYVAGETLARLMKASRTRGQRIPPEMVATMMAGVLHGLHAAHEATDERGEPLHIVHRDVSPQNVLVGTDGVARVLDFGVAKAMGRSHITREGQLKGKLAYMAPEQVHGEASRTTDVYSAAIVLWEALTGAPLFHGENDAQVLARVLTGCRSRPSEHVRDLPAALDAVTMRGLSLHASERFQTARDMARALEEAVSQATASKIGEWVEEAARATLADRSARVARIESDSAMNALPRPSEAGAGTEVPSAPSAVGRSGARLSANERAWRMTTEDGLTQLSSGSVSSPRLVGAQGQRLRIATAVAGACLLTGALTLAVSRPSSTPAPPLSVGPIAAVSTAPQLPSEQAPAPPTTGSSSTPAAQAAPEEGPRLPAPVPPPSAVRMRSPAKPAARTATSPTCTVETTYDDEGQPHFKKVCK